MIKQLIEVVTYDEQRVALSDVFTFNHDKGYICLQKICFWILTKIGAFQDTVTFARHLVRTEDFMEKLFTQHEDIKYLFGKKPSVLLIGSSDLHQLLGAGPDRHYFEFCTEYRIKSTIYNLTVKVVPWMQGILVMP